MNKRKTYRDILQIKGIFSIVINEIKYTENIIIQDITYNGMHIVFSNNEIMHSIMIFFQNNKTLNVDISFEYFNHNIQTSSIIKWLKINDLGEKDYYIDVGLAYKELTKDNNKTDILDLILDIRMSDFYIEKPEKIEDSLLG